MNKKYYIIAGEASGDLHASRLMKEMLILDSNINFRFYGGDLMLAVGGELVKHYKELAFMGLWEVIQNIKTIKRNMTACKEDIVNWQPDAVILVDYPGFNLRIAKFVHELGIKVYYHISPKVWVWKQSRVKKIKQFIDKMFVIFPFEIDFYKKYNYPVLYYGNPTAELVADELKKELDENNFRRQNNLSNKPIVALLPGSRVQEINKLMPIMIKVSKEFDNFEFVIAGINSISTNIYVQFTKNTNLNIVYGKTFDLLKISYLAVVTSGTATLETALFNVPQVVCYKTSSFTYSIGKNFVNIEYFSLVNILMCKEVVKEFLQNNLENDIVTELKRLSEDIEYRNTMLSDYKSLKELLGDLRCNEKIANYILNS